MSNSKKYNHKYWEDEEAETVEFGNSFMRVYDEAGKMQFGKVIKNKETDEKRFIVKFVMDRKDLFESKEGKDFLLGAIDFWEENYQ